MKQFISASRSSGSTSRIVMGVIGLIALLISTVLAIVLTRSILADISHASEIVSLLGHGDLTMKIDANATDETGLLKATQYTIEQLRSIVTEVKGAADNVASASTELSASSDQMSRATKEQEARSGQIASATAEMSQTVMEVAQNANAISSAAAKSSDTARKGGEIVGKAVEEVKAIARTVSDSALTMRSLGDISQKIGEIIGVIEDIADQTNLLALNAAIEAARAGEQGRGFAVVADEVRKLAERTAGATAEIGTMIGRVQNEVGKAVTSTEQATKQAEVGVNYATTAGEALQNIVGSVDDLQSMISSIASATEEMTTTSDQISGDLQGIAASSDDRDKRELVERCMLLFPETSTTCYAWSILSNRVHLFLRTGLVPLSTVMACLLTGFAASLNRRQHRSGQPFQNRYKSIICQEDVCFKELVRYVHLNPLRAELVPDVEALCRFPWSGHAVLLGKMKCQWQDTAYALPSFGGKASYPRFGDNILFSDELPRGFS